MYSRTMVAGWADMDYNAHMANTAYLNKSVDTRLSYFAENGFPASEFEKLGIGPVILRETVEYFREIRLLQEITVTLEIAGLSPSADRFRIRNEFFRSDGERCARITTYGGWLDLSLRKLVEPPALLAKSLDALTRTDDYEALPRKPRKPQ